jgi:hypothetical protein
MDLIPRPEIVLSPGLADGSHGRMFDCHESLLFRAFQTVAVTMDAAERQASPSPKTWTQRDRPGSVPINLPVDRMTGAGVGGSGLTEPTFSAKARAGGGPRRIATWRK